MGEVFSSMDESLWGLAPTQAEIEVAEEQTAERVRNSDANRNLSGIGLATLEFELATTFDDGADVTQS